MAINRNKTIVQFEKVVLLCIRTIYRSASCHPFVFSLVFFVLVFYISFPSLFAFLVSSSPVIVCTTLLLGLLLSYGEPNISEIKDESKRTVKVSSEIVGNTSNHQYVMEDENLSIENHVENRNYNERVQLRETILLKEKATAREDINQASELHDGNKILHMIVEIISSTEDQMQKENYETEVIQEELHGRTISKDINLHVGGLGDAAELDENTTPLYIADKQENQNLELDVDETAADHHFDSSLGLPWLSVGGNHYSDSESDRADSSSPDASMADIIPMLGELHPLLNFEHPQHVSASKSDAASEVSTLDHEIDDNSVYEEDEKGGEKRDGEAPKDRDDGAEDAVKWTEDDQKNVMDLGSSELERDRRLESLIVKRRARKNLTFRMDRNLINWDINNRFLTVDELSRFHVQVPARRNPFDSSYGSDEAMDLPPIPGSAPAPSSLLHRRNPFDLFYDQQEQDSSLTGETWGHQDLVSTAHREMLFEGNYAFGLGKMEIRQERRHSRLKPYFIAEKIDSEVGMFTFHRQFSDKSESKVNFIPESDAVSSATDQDFNKVLQEHESQQENELLYLAKHNTDGGDRESHISEGESIDIEEEETGQLIKTLDTDENPYHIIQGSDQVVGYFGAIKKDTREKNYQNFPTSESEKLEMIEQKHDESNTSSSLEDHYIFETFPESPNLCELEAVNNINDINFSLSSAKSRESDPIHVDVSCDLEGEEMVEITKTKASSPSNVLILPDDSALSEFQKLSSMEKYSSSSHDVGGEETQVSSFDLYSISEESQNDVEQKKDDPSYSNHNQIDHRTGFPLYENLKFLGSDTAQQTPFFQKPIQEIDHTDDNVKILHEPEGSTSYISPVIPIQEYGLAGSQLVELSESTNSIASEMSEIRVHPICDLFRSVVDIKSPVLVKNEIGSSEILDDSEEESDVVHNLALENDGIDDNLLADIEGAVFFSSDQQNLDTMFQNDRQTEAITSSSRISLDHDYKLSENTSSPYAAKLVNSSSELLASVVSDSVTGNSKASRLVLNSTGIDTSQSNMKQTLTVSELPAVELEARFSENIQLSFKQIEASRPVAEASLVEEVDSGFNRLLEEAMVSAVSEPSIDKPTLPKFVVESSERDSIDSELSVVEARSLENITAAFSEGTFDKPLHLDSGFRNSPGNAHLGSMLIQSDLHVVEAKSIEDINEAFSQLSHNTTRKAMDPNAHVKDASLVQEVDSGSNYLSEEGQEAMAPGVSGSDIKKPTPVKLLESNEKDSTDSELPVVEARSVEDIREAFLQISEGTRDKPCHHDSCSENSQGNAHLDVVLIQSDLHVVEAKSIEDIDEAFSQLSHNITSKAPEKMDPNMRALEGLVQEVNSAFNEFPDEAIVSGILESGIDKPAPPILVLESSEKHSTYSELPVVEARSLEDIAAAFIQISEGSLSKPLHHDSGSQNSSSNAHMDSMLMQSDLHDVEAKSIEDIDEAFSQLSNRSNRKAPEKIDLNMQVIEASLVQEVESGFSPFPEDFIVPSVSDFDVNKPTSQKLFRESSVKDSTDTELPLVEARSIEDIREAFIQISEGSHYKTFHHDSVSQKSPGTVHLDAMLMHSDLHVVDAKSIEEIDEASRQLSCNKTKKASEQMEKAAETVKTSVLEMHHSDDISLTFKEPSVSDTSLSIEKAGAERIGDATAALPLNLSIQKKHWHNKSASSSSSSSSTSSSDSEIYENK